MTQPPDDDALVARLRNCADQMRQHNLDRDHSPVMPHPEWLTEAATALEAKDRRIAEIREALRLIAEMQRDRFGSAARHSKWCQRTARAALEPSDKGVGR